MMHTNLSIAMNTCLQACLCVNTFTGHCGEIAHTLMIDILPADGQQAVKKELKGPTP